MEAPGSFSPVVVVPTYNNAETVVGVLRRIEALGLSIIVVNDGSTDDTAERLSRWVQGVPIARVFTHEQNPGKAAAMLTGFQIALQAGHTHAVTIDSDGQLDPEEIPLLLDAARANPRALVLGVRSLETENYPLGSRIGRRFSNLAIFLECGRRVYDSQCGLRAYPLRLIECVRCRANRFGWEAEVITLAAWAGFDIVQVPVTCRYAPRGQHKSHFRTWVDTRRGLALHARLLARAMLPWPHKRCVEVEVAKQAPPADWWRSLLHWINPLRAWRAIFDPGFGRGETAAAFATGVFIANLPIYPLQSAAALYVAHRLHLHPAVTFAGSALSTPPLGIVLVGAAIATGHLLLTGQWPALSDYDLSRMQPAQMVGMTLLEWLIGSLIIGTLTAMAAFAFAYAAIGIARQRRSPCDDPGGGGGGR